MLPTESGRRTETTSSTFLSERQCRSKIVKAGRLWEDEGADHPAIDVRIYESVNCVRGDMAKGGHGGPERMPEGESAGRRLSVESIMGRGGQFVQFECEI